MANRETLEITYRRLDEILPLPSNAKLHDLEEIKRKIQTFGFIDPIGVSAETMHDLDGNGRLNALKALYAAGENAPKNIQTKREKGADGKLANVWYAPTVSLKFSREDEPIVALSLNRTAQRGGFDDKAVFAILEQASASGRLDDTGYDQSALENLAIRYAPAPEFQLPNGSTADNQQPGNHSNNGQVTAGVGVRIGTPQPELQPSHVRMVQLFLNTETHPVFLELASALLQNQAVTDESGKPVDNLTDLCFHLVRQAAEPPK